MQLEVQSQPLVRSCLLSAAIALIVGLVLGPSRARARDLPRSDPDRKLILDSARGEDSVKLIVKDLYKEGDFAFLCALKRHAEYGIIGTDESLDVYEWVVIRDDGRWTAYDSGEGFAQTAKSASCSSTARTGGGGGYRVKSKADIIDALVEATRWGLLNDMAGRHSIEDFLPLLELLRRKGLEAGISMDGEKVLEGFRVSRLSEVCESARCNAENQRIFSRIESLRKSDGVNALAWRICDDNAGRTDSAAEFERCLKAATAEPACRTGLRMPRDRKTLEQCAATLSR